MFTGLIKTQGKIRRVDQRGDCIMTIAMQEPFAVEVGDSIACHGICLTATKITGNEFKVSLSNETMVRTNAGTWEMGTMINLEPSLRVGDAMGGHFVSGHIDGLATAISAEKSGDSTVWIFEVPGALARYIAPKGSITIDGVSLTVNEVARHAAGATSAPQQVAAFINVIPKTYFSVNIIPHTAEITCFGHLQIGQAVNIEIDMLARYVARLQEASL